MINQPHHPNLNASATGYPFPFPLPPANARSPGFRVLGGPHITARPGTSSVSPSPSAAPHPSSAQHSSPQSHFSLPSLNNTLPPIRDIEAGPPQSPLTTIRLQRSALFQQHQAILNMGTPLPPPAQQQLPPPPPPASQQQQMSYYAAQALPPTSPHMGVAQEGAQLRYPLPPDNRMMSAQRHKRDIKRRTKTGCMTCRKRRIKVGGEKIPLTTTQRGSSRTRASRWRAVVAEVHLFTEKANRLARSVKRAASKRARSVYSTFSRIPSRSPYYM